jgi:hypothetical protein
VSSTAASVSRKNQASAVQALRNVWARGGADIPASVISLLRRWDRAGGRSVDDADYGRNVWDRLIIAGIWPVELLAGGLGSLVIIAILAGQRLNHDLQNFHRETWPQGAANVGLIASAGLCILGVLLLVAGARQALSNQWRARDRRGRAKVVIGAAAVISAACLIVYLWRNHPGVSVGNPELDWLLSGVWGALGYFSFAVLGLAGIAGLLLLIAAQGPSGTPQSFLQGCGTMLRDLAALGVHRIAAGGRRAWWCACGWTAALACLAELARLAGPSLAPWLAALLLAWAVAGLAWLTWPMLPTIVAVAGILLTVVLVGISGTLLAAGLMLGWAVCLWRMIGVRAARERPGPMLTIMQWLLTTALSLDLFVTYVII